MPSKRHRITKKIRGYLGELARTNYELPFYRVMETADYVGIEGSEYKTHLKGSGKDLPSGFEEGNFYPVPEAEVFQHTKGTLYKEIVRTFTAGGGEAVKRLITDLRKEQVRYANHNSGEPK